MAVAIQVHLLLVVLLLGPLATHHHRAAEAHAVCEHGEQIHVGRDPHPADDGAHEPGFTPARPGNGDHGDAHDHCAAAATAVAVASPTATAATAVRVAGEVDLPPSAAVVRTAALFRLAPKTSPPV